MFFSVFKWTKKSHRIFVRISALASKKSSCQKKSLKVLKAPLSFFDSTSFQRQELKSLQKIRWFFGQFEDTKRTFLTFLTFRSPSQATCFYVGSYSNENPNPKPHNRSHLNSVDKYKWLTFFLSLMEPLPRTIILQPVSCSNCLVVMPRGPKIRPTKLNCK